MASVTLEEAQGNLGGLIHQLAPGDELIVTEGNQPIDRIVIPKPRVKLGAMRDSVVYMAPNFDAPLDDSRSARVSRPRRWLGPQVSRLIWESR